MKERYATHEEFLRVVHTLSPEAYNRLLHIRNQGGSVLYSIHDYFLVEKGFVERVSEGNIVAKITALGLKAIEEMEG